MQLMVVRLWRGVAVVGERRVVLRRKKKKGRRGRLVCMVVGILIVEGAVIGILDGRSD